MKAKELGKFILTIRSCKTLIQLENAYRWSTKCISNYHIKKEGGINGCLNALKDVKYINEIYNNKLKTL